MTFVREVHQGYKDPSQRFIKTATTSIRFGEIVRVDPEEMTADIIWLDGVGSYYKLNISAAYAGYRSFLGAMPAKGDWVICSFSKAGTLTKPVLVQFMPKGYISGINNDLIKPPPELEVTGAATALRFKMQKLYEGELYGASTYGSEFYLDRNVTISNSVLNEINLRASDQTISLNALNNVINSAGVKTSSGLITRDALIAHPDFQVYQGVSKFPIFYDFEGLPHFIVTYADFITNEYPYGRQTIDDGKSAFTEHRIDVEELTTPVMSVLKSNSGVDVDSPYKDRTDGTIDQPLVTQVLGTLVGNDYVSAEGKKVYGVVLKPKIFSDTKDDAAASLIEEACLISDGKDETATLAAAYTLKFPKTSTAFYINKEGKYLANIGASSRIDSAGSGESAEINLNGHAKVRLGKNTARGRSLTLYTDGGIRSNIGFDNDKTRSWDATFRKGVSWNILGNDADKTGFILNVNGDVREVIEGSKFTEIKGNDVRLVHGVIEDRIFGKKIDNFIGDKTTNYGGNYQETVVQSYEQTIGTGRKVSIQAPNILKGSTVADETKILFGDSTLSMLLGSRKEDIKAGNHSTTILAGNKSVSITAGNYSIKVTAGNINIQTSLGSLNFKTTVGTVNIEGALGVNIKSAGPVNIQAPKVQVGSLPQGGPVNDGPCGQPCYFTGARHIGAKSVTVNTI